MVLVEKNLKCNYEKEKEKKEEYPIIKIMHTQKNIIYINEYPALGILHTKKDRNVGVAQARI